VLLPRLGGAGEGEIALRVGRLLGEQGERQEE